MSRCPVRHALGLLLLVVPLPCFGFGLDDVAERARKLATSPYKSPQSVTTKELRTLTYDQYRDIRFKPDRNIWREEKLPFELAFFHAGFNFAQTVRINEVSASGPREIPFRADSFDYGANKIDPKAIANSGFAGFRVHYPINSNKYKDEVLVFLGASYFRALGKGQRYGISARALAIDTALSSGEEFPRFVELWIERPNADARSLTVFALLDSRRATGAYRFVITPGVETALEVKAHLFLRENVAKLALAPLTSMFFYGENRRANGDAYRPEVHDSDGLSIHAGTGEWIWRPLTNPRRLLTTSFALTNPAGFGLMQRDRSFASYEDLEARYELRPSVWVEPRGKWGEGRIELVQIPTPDETNDNIVAFWVPAVAPRPLEAFEFEYRLLWQKDTEARPPLAWVAQTRRGHGYQTKPDGTLAFAVDFAGPPLSKLSADTKVQGIVAVDGNAQIVENVTFHNEVTGGWRMALRLRRADDKKPIEVRAFLRVANETLSETWSYIIPPV